MYRVCAAENENHHVVRDQVSGRKKDKLRSAWKIT